MSATVTRQVVSATPATQEQQPLWPLNAPGMPIPGDPFLTLARARGGNVSVVADKKSKTKKHLVSYSRSVEQVIRQALYGQATLSISTPIKNGKFADLTVIGGHRWGANPDGPSTGPEPCEVMVVSKMLGDTEVNLGRCMRGPPGVFLLDKLTKLGVRKLSRWYVTNALKTENPDPNEKSLKASWVSDHAHLLQQELRLVKPRFLLCLGVDAVKAVLGKSMTIEKIRGRVIELEIDMRKHVDDPPETHVIQVMACEHPGSVMREPDKEPRFELDLARFHQLTQGVRWDRKEEGLDHRVITNELQLRELIHEAEQSNPSRIVSIDAEWHGNHPVNAGAYLRCIQFSWKHKSAACIQLTRPGGSPGFARLVRDKEGRPVKKDGKLQWTYKGGQELAIQMLDKYLADKRLVGHFANADLEWLVAYGLDVRKQFMAPEDWRDCREQGGWDTGLMAHALCETDLFSLTDQTLRYTLAPRYDVALDEWKSTFCKKHGLKASQLEGYGECPESVLYPYACLHQDSLVQLGDGTWRKIGELVRTRYSGTVKAMLDGKVVNAPVVGWHRADVRQKEWFQLRTATTPAGRFGLLGPKLTPDHKVLTQRGKVRVDALRPGSDSVLTDEVQFSSEQLSVFLGSGLGDGGYVRQNDKRVGFGFGQCVARAAYADWKAEVFGNYGPAAIDAGPTRRRYVLPFSRYLRWLSERFPAHEREQHRHRKLILTQDVLDNLGDLGLAVWYQDDGVLVRDKRSRHQSSRIICQKLTEPEVALAVAWLTQRFGEGVTYNRQQGFLQITGAAFTAFHQAVDPHIHPALAYKAADSSVVVAAKSVPAGTALFYERIEEVVPWVARQRRGSGVRYCLTVEKAHNFLTQVGFVSNCYDADVTRRIALRHAKHLDCDAYGNNCWEAFWISQRAMPAALEITMTGMLVDRKRMDTLTADFMAARNELASRIRDRFNWPDLNLDSSDQVRELMFGTELNGKRDDKGRPIRLRPMTARSLRAMPAITTCKRPKEWEKVIEEGAADNYKPSTNKMALGILLRESKKLRVRRGSRWIVKDYGPEIELIRNYRFISQVLKSVLRKPLEREEEDLDDPWERDEDGNWVYESGLPGAICTDTRVRTFVSQIKETGRWSTSRPPTQNFSKRREADYKKILKDYKYPLRSIFMADPGYVFVEADFVGAELFGMAIMSGDLVMIDHATRNQLPEDHPNFYDIHSNIAVLAFGYKCAPTKKGLRDIGKEHMRIVAKSVIFGVAYGRGAKAIALAAREEGVTVSVEEAQRIIDTIFEMYPGLVPFFQECKERAVQSLEKDAAISPRFLCGPFGRYRRFPLTKDREVIGEYERQAMNFTIQGMIADAMSRAVDHLQEYRRQHKLGFKIAMQIHDALLFLVPCAEVPHFIDEVLPECMSRRVPIYPCRLDGTPTGAGPYHLGTDNEISTHWGVHMLPHECWNLGVPEKYAGWQTSKTFDGGWVCSYFNRRVWLERTQRLHDLVIDKAGKEMLKETAVATAIKRGKLTATGEISDLVKKVKTDDLLQLLTDEAGLFVAL